MMLSGPCTVLVKGSRLEVQICLPVVFPAQPHCAQKKCTLTAQTPQHKNTKHFAHALLEYLWQCHSSGSLI